MANNFTNMLSNLTYTDNGALSLASTRNANLDFFFASGSWDAKTPLSEILGYWEKAFKEDVSLALKNLFHLRDIHEGKGRRRPFRVIWSTLSKDIQEKFMKDVPSYGRWDDLLVSNIDYLARLIREAYNNPNHNIENFWLLAKWMPRKGQDFYTLAKLSGLSFSQLRKFLVKNTNVVETTLSERKFNEVEYNTVPSRAFVKYQKAFIRNDEKRYMEFMSSVEKGETKINTNNILPADVYRMCNSGLKEDITQTIWKNLMDLNIDSNLSFIPVVDVSGSMEGVPMENAVSLGIYLAEKNKSSFKNFLISFSEIPCFIDLEDNLSFEKKMKQVLNMPWGYNTNIEKIFDIVLERAKVNNLAQEDMPDNIIILSDMQFDEASNNRKTNFEVIKEKYAEYGYKMPQLVFWNLKSSTKNFVSGANEEGVFLVSGNTPNVIKTFVKTGKFKNALSLMLETLNAERYKKFEI